MVAKKWGVRHLDFAREEQKWKSKKPKNVVLKCSCQFLFFYILFKQAAQLGNWDGEYRRSQNGPGEIWKIDTTIFGPREYQGTSYHVPVDLWWWWCNSTSTEPGTWYCAALFSPARLSLLTHTIFRWPSINIIHTGSMTIPANARWVQGLLAISLYVGREYIMWSYKYR